MLMSVQQIMAWVPVNRSVTTIKEATPVLVLSQDMNLKKINTHALVGPMVID